MKRAKWANRANNATGQKEQNGQKVYKTQKGATFLTSHTLPDLSWGTFTANNRPSESSWFRIPGSRFMLGSQRSLTLKFPKRYDIPYGLVDHVGPLLVDYKPLTIFPEFLSCIRTSESCCGNAPLVVQSTCFALPSSAGTTLRLLDD